MHKVAMHWEGHMKIAVPSDGHCLFYCFAIALNSIRWWIRSTDDERLDAQATIRQEIAQYLRANRREFERLLIVAEDFDGTFDEYCTEVEHSRWGMEPEIAAGALLHKFRVRVICTEVAVWDPERRTSIHNEDGTKELTLLFSGSHYEMIVKQCAL
eukprot:TRINITY_DN2960_c0_g1_i4.p1 TRINITY_DN2960_c0_g1~~TRINITY_DN2960_c0_g1_i4.p1  ORF type:complete len:156 (+),score=14.61 TRINITY_DN2960_c0_g1_i4:334-801(+)